MNTVFVEIIFSAKDLAKTGIQGRDELEDPLTAALEQSGIAEVTGGGSGMGLSHIDVEISSEEHLDRGIATIRRVLQELGVPYSTVIRRNTPKPIEYRIYD